MQRLMKLAAYGSPLIVVILVMAAFARPERNPSQRRVLAPTEEPAVVKVSRGPVTLTVTERGEIESANRANVVCRVRNENPRGDAPVTQIRWLIEDATTVKKGDKVVELDDSAIKERLTEQGIVVAEKKADVLQAEADLKVVDAQVKADVQTAEANVELAKLEVQTAADVSDRAVQKLEIRLRLAKFALETLKKTPGTELELKRAEAEVEIAEIDLKIHHAQGLAERGRADASLLKAKVALDASKLRAVAQRARAEAQVRAAQAALAVEEEKLKAIQEDIDNCTLRAPKDGVVEYYLSEDFFRRPQRLVAVNEPVRQDQILLRIVDPKNLQVRLKVPEATAPHVKAGQKAVIRVVPLKQPLQGRVRSISPLAAQADWFASDVKVYPALIEIIDPPESLKPGMSADVSIVVAERDDVLRVPAKAILQQGTETLCEVKDGVTVRLRPVKLGLRTPEWAEITEGLREGEEVVVHAAKPDAPAVSPRPGGRGDPGPARGLDTLDRYRKATPAERKAMLEQVPEPLRGRMRQMLKEREIEIPDQKCRLATLRRSVANRR